MKKILAIIATATAIAGAADNFTVLVCPISQVKGACTKYKVNTMPRFEISTVMIDLGNGKHVIYNLAGWSISISN